MAVTPEKLSGICGRLKCCLRYEHEVYLEASRAFPKPGSFVEEGDVRGKVLSIDVIGRTVLLRTPDRAVVRVPLTAVHPPEKIPRTLREDGSG